MPILKILLIVILSSGLSACGMWDRTWNWFFEDEEAAEVVMEEDIIDEEYDEYDEYDDEYYEDEDEYYEEEDEYYEEEDEYYEEEPRARRDDRRKGGRKMGKRGRRGPQYDEYDDYGDEPRRRGRQAMSRFGDESAGRGRMQPQQQAMASPRKTVIYFDYKQTSVPASGMNLLQMHAQFLQQNPQRLLTVEGHTDSVASAEYNRRLGMKRAQAVANTLMQMGIPESQINTVSYGQERPAQQGTSDAANAMNRRVELLYK